MTVLKRIRIAGMVLFVFAAGGMLASCHLVPRHADEDSDSQGNSESPVRLTIENGVPTLNIAAPEQQDAGIIAQRLDPAPPQVDVHGFGTVLDPGGLTSLRNRYRDAKAQVAVAKARLAGSQAAYKRALILNKDQQNISTARLQSARSTFDVDAGTLSAAQARATAVIADARQAWGATLADAIAANDPSIADLTSRRAYLVRVTLPPGVAIAAPPQTASALYGATDVQLRFVSLATTADPKLQGVSYFYKAQMKNLLPGLTFDVALAVGRAQPGLIVPDSAVVWLDGKAWIYIRSKPTTFIRRAINPARAAPHGGYVVTGLAPDARIVIRGAQTLLSEEFRGLVPVED
jgi:hypothetical protein